MLSDIQLSFILGIILGGLIVYSGYYCKMMWDWYKTPNLKTVKPYQAHN